MYKIYHLILEKKIVGVAVSRGSKVARYFRLSHLVDYDYYDEVGQVKHFWMLLALFAHKYPDMINVESDIEKGMNLRVFLMHDGTQDSCQWTNVTDGQENQKPNEGEPDDSWLNNS